MENIIMNLKQELRDWLAVGKQRSATHMLVICDISEQENYPIYVLPHEDARNLSAIYDNSRYQKVVEVYNLQMDWEEQLNSRSVYNIQ